jgi:hypothetical protein
MSPAVDVLREFFDPVALAAEFDATVGRRSAGMPFLYVPMMCERTPVSLALLDRLAAVVANRLGRPVLPGRAKGTRYAGDTDRHVDSELSIPTVGCLAYLEPLTDETGALRVMDDVIETMPGDVIVMDERAMHSSAGGGERRQWRVDFIVDPRDATEEEMARVWYVGVFPTDGSAPVYDAERYPSFGPYWQSLDRPWTKRLRELGVYELSRGH